MKFPKFRIRLVIKEYKGLPTTHCLPATHWILCQKMNIADHPYDYQLFYATKNTNGWVKLPMEGRFDALPKKMGGWLGCWIPAVLAEDPKEKRRFRFPDPESPIIWRLDYKSKHLWHSICEMFTWNGERWGQKNWDDHYTHGLLAHLLLRGDFFTKSKNQIKKWKKGK